MSSRIDTFPIRLVADAVGSAPVTWRPVATRGYARSNAHWRVEFADGEAAFVKQALTPDAVGWLRTERLVYESVGGPFMPAFIGASGGEDAMVIVLEDLTGADWPPPWSPGSVQAVLASLEALRGTPPPPGIEKLGAIRAEIVGWPDIANDPEPLLSTRLCTGSWLERALPTLLQASADAHLDGPHLLHFDVRSDNLCLRDGRAVLVDWNLAHIGNGELDIAFWLPSLALEGGPSPWDVLRGAGPLSAAVAGFFAARAGLPPPPTAPTVRGFQRAQAEVALTWAARELQLEPIVTTLG